MCIRKCRMVLSFIQIFWSNCYVFLSTTTESHEAISSRFNFCRQSKWKWDRGKSLNFLSMFSLAKLFPHIKLYYIICRRHRRLVCLLRTQPRQEYFFPGAHSLSKMITQICMRSSVSSDGDGVWESTHRNGHMKIRTDVSTAMGCESFYLIWFVCIACSSGYGDVYETRAKSPKRYM